MKKGSVLWSKEENEPYPWKIQNNFNEVNNYSKYHSLNLWTFLQNFYGLSLNGNDLVNLAFDKSCRFLIVLVWYKVSDADSCSYPVTGNTQNI